MNEELKLLIDRAFIENALNRGQLDTIESGLIHLSRVVLSSKDEQRDFVETYYNTLLVDSQGYLNHIEKELHDPQRISPALSDLRNHIRVCLWNLKHQEE